LQKGCTQETEEINSELCTNPLISSLPPNTIQEDIMALFCYMPHNEVSKPQVLCCEMQMSTQFWVLCLYSGPLHLSQKYGSSNFILTDQYYLLRFRAL
jgi:hypothetical protein